MDNLNLKNHFEKFDLIPSFDIDLDVLEEKYLTFQHIFHPDKLVGKEAQIDLEYNSVLINEAYQILKNPLKRAIYLLKLKKIDIDNDNCPIKPDQETLISNLELREFIFETEDKEKLENLKKSCGNEIKLILKTAKSDFEQKNYEKAALNLIKAKYLDKSVIEIKKKLNPKHD